jgi:hypothetical protein
LTPFVAGSPSNVPLTLTNSGTAPDNGPITSTITLPAGFSTANNTFNPIVGTTCVRVNQVITCTTAGPLSNVAPSNTTVFNLPITPDATTVGLKPTTTASVSSPNEPVANQGNNTAAPMAPTDAVVGVPDLVTSIGQPSPALVVDVQSLLPVTVTNQGSAPATGTIITTITLPAGITTLGVFVTNGSTCSTNLQVVTCYTSGPISNVNPSNTLVLNIPITPTASTVNTKPGPFTATTFAPNEPATNTTNNPAPNMILAQNVAPAPAPNVIIALGQPLTPFVVGTASVVPVTITNIGSAPETGSITSIFTLPAGFSTTSGTFSPVVGTSCTTVGQVTTCTTNGPLSNISGSNTKGFNLSITPSAVNVNNAPTTTASVSSPNEPAGNQANNTTSMVPAQNVAPAPAPDVIVALGQPLTSFVAGTASVVPVTISNIGTASETGSITSVITLPAGFSTTSGTFSPVVGTSCTTVGQVTTCTTTGPLSNVSGSNTKGFNLSITPSAVNVNNAPTTTASVSSPNEPAANQANNTTSMIPAQNVAAAPAPNISISLGQPLTPFVVGSPSLVPVTITNSGTGPENGSITSIITLPVGFNTTNGQFFPAVGTTCTTVGQVATCVTTGPLSNVSPSNTIIFNLPVTPMASTVNTQPTTTASVSSPNEPAANQGNNIATPMSPNNPVAPAPVVDVKVNVKVFLQGAYNSATGLMSDDLRSRGFIPTAQPYSAMTRTSYHTGTETTTAAVFATTGANAIVDWVLLELRTGTGVATRIATRAALVQRDGDIVDVDGVSPVTFANRTAGTYYVAVTHRNHLGAMSEVGVGLSATATTVDFTGAYDGFGTNAMKAIGNLNALWAGNANHSGTTHRNTIFSGANNDPDAVKNNVLTAQVVTPINFSYIPTGYHLGDTNLDGDVKYQGPSNDVDNLIFFNVLTHPGNLAPSVIYTIGEQY